MFAPRYLFVLASLVIQNEASRILVVIPTPSISHQVVFRPLILELLKRDHEIVLITADPMFEKGNSPANLREIDVHDISYEIWKKVMLNADITNGSEDDFYEQGNRFYKALQKIFEKQLLTSEMQSLMKDESNNFDLLILEAYYTPILMLTHVFKAPVIQMSSLMPLNLNMKAMGLPRNIFVYPECSQQRFVNLTTWEKISLAYKSYSIEHISDEEEEITFTALKRLFSPDIPPLKELNNNVDMLFVNIHPIWDSNRPVPPNIIHIGGIHTKPEKELPQELKSYLDSSKYGVIYVSFGSNVDPSFMPQEKFKILLKVFSKLPYDILFKWNADELPGRSENVRISKWLPQTDLLRHPKLRLFITQAGLQSTDEAIMAGVPLLGIPMLGDQWYNAELYVKYKIGLKLDLSTITEEKLNTAVQTILNDKSYRDNILKMRSIILDQPQTALERATWWTEYVLRHKGAKHLKSPAANMPLTEYYQIEIISYLLIATVSLAAILIVIICYLSSLCLSNRNGSKLKKS